MDIFIESVNQSFSRRLGSSTFSVPHLDTSVKLPQRMSLLLCGNLALKPGTLQNPELLSLFNQSSEQDQIDLEPWAHKASRLLKSVIYRAFPDLRGLQYNVISKFNFNRGCF